ncbi:hypothetical protein BH11MYX1_BH11MYX1_58040 [soil metagenome]
MRVAITLSCALLFARAAHADDEISDARITGGTVASIALGFGAGQAIEGRYGETGWIFTAGEAVAVAGFAIGLHEGGIQDPCDACHPNKSAALLALSSLLVLGGLRLWEVADAIEAPREANARLRRMQAPTGAMPFVVPSSNGVGAVAGLSMGF